MVINDGDVYDYILENFFQFFFKKKLLKFEHESFYIRNKKVLIMGI
tara:strand:+ start:2097 stop:2234 length:138 start_codon:yes stop_codon:yes gene_type:complete